MSPRLSTFSAFLRYFVVAACGFCVDFSVYAVLVRTGVSVYFANAVGFGVGAAANVVLIRKFVFKNSRFPLGVDVPLTVAANGMMLGVGMGMLWLWINWVSLDPYSAKLLANAVFVLNCVTRAVFFRHK